jgi:hypothetical protein
LCGTRDFLEDSRLIGKGHHQRRTHAERSLSSRVPALVRAIRRRADRSVELRCVSGLLGDLALLATYQPAHRAATIDPVVALR